MGQQDNQLLTEALDCMRQGKELVKALDNAPYIIRSTQQAVQARAVSVRALKLVAELVRRIQADHQAAKQGGDDGDEK